MTVIFWKYLNMKPHERRTLQQRGATQMESDMDSNVVHPATFTLVVVAVVLLVASYTSPRYMSHHSSTVHQPTASFDSDADASLHTPHALPWRLPIVFRHVASIVLILVHVMV